MFAKFLKPQFTRWMGVILIGALLLAVPAATVSAAAPTPTPAQPAGQGSKATPAKLATAYQKELQALKTQDVNLTKVDTLLGKADTLLTGLKDKGKDVEILQTVLNQFKQDVATANGFHNAATQILNTHSGFDSTGTVVGQAQALTTDQVIALTTDQIKMITIKRVPVTISLLDDAGAATMVWTLTNAWPTKITMTDLKSEGNEVAIETIEVAHEGITVANG